MRLLQRHILYELLRVFALLLAVVTMLVLSAGVLHQMMQIGLRPSDLLRMLPFIILSLLPFTLPATLLMSICVVYGRMAVDHEFTATKAAGISVMTQFVPPLVLGGMLSCLTFVLKDQGIPIGISRLQQFALDAAEDMVLSRLKADGQFSEVSSGYSMAVVRLDGRRLIQPSFRLLSGAADTTFISASSATIRTSPDRGFVSLDLQKGRVLFANGTRCEFDENQLTLPLGTPMLRWKARHVPIAEIRHKIEEFQQLILNVKQRRAWQTAMALTIGEFQDLKSDQTVRLLKFEAALQRQICRCHKEMHNRVALSAGCFLFAFVGAPFAVLRGQRHFLTTFLLCFLPIIALYYPLVILMMNLADSGSVGAWWSAWIPNAVLLVLGLVVSRRVLRR